MARLWKLALGVVIVVAIAVWDIGLPGKHSAADSASGNPSPSPSATSTLPSVPEVAGVIHPAGAPEFAATFTGSKLNTSVWDTCYSFYSWLNQTGSGCTNFGNAQETEWYLPSQDKVSGGELHLVATRKRTAGTTASDSPKTYYCRSGMITSEPSFKFKYGYVQVRADIPASTGLWPALWLRPITTDWKPEIDLVEGWGAGDVETAGSYFHPHHGHETKVIYRPAKQITGWHTFAVSWTSTQMTWLIDGKVTLVIKKQIPHVQMYFVANLAGYKPVGPLNPCSGQLSIQSVDVWKA